LQPRVAAPGRRAIPTKDHVESAAAAPQTSRSWSRAIPRP
jgi:hypothetical protein